MRADDRKHQKPENPVFHKTFNILVGNNRLALEAAKKKAIDLNLNTEIISDRLEGDITEVAEYLVETSLRYQRESILDKPCCLLFGGEPTSQGHRDRTWRKKPAPCFMLLRIVEK